MKQIPLLCAAFVLLACNKNDSTAQESAAPTEQKTTTLAEGLSNPWGMAFLPDGLLLITERSGNLRILDTQNALSEPLTGVPAVFANSQGGLLDVAIDPEFADNNLVYLSYAEAGPGGTAGTALGRGELTPSGISNFTVLFRQEPKAEGGIHFGSRIVFHEGYLYLTMGDRNQRHLLQDLSVHLGTVIRINPDGSIPADNPFVGQAGANEEIWSYGHRNVQGADIDPATGNLWVSEMGPQHGDEVNHVVKGQNYGWPVVSWGSEYGGEPIPNHDTEPQFATPAHWWEPSIAPSGMTFYTGTMFPQYQGHLLIGGLRAMGIVVVKIDNTEAEEVGRIELDARIRDVQQAPDGAIYVLTDEPSGKLMRIAME